MRRSFLIIAVWLMMAGLVLTPLQIFGQTKIAVISDPHVISEELAENPDAWGTTVSGSRKLLDYSKEVFDVLMAKFASEKPDILLISGDLTEDGDNPSLRAKREKVTEVPSNADFQTLAENRLRASIEQKALSEISKKISSNPMVGLLVNEETRNKLAQLTGSVFIVHAEGDEDQSEVAAELKNKLGGLASLVSMQRKLNKYKIILI